MKIMLAMFFGFGVAFAYMNWCVACWDPAMARDAPVPEPELIDDMYARVNPHLPAVQAVECAEPPEIVITDRNVRVTVAIPGTGITNTYYVSHNELLLPVAGNECSIWEEDEERNNNKRRSM